MLITIFTPTYNRGYIIGKLYESLKKQSFRDFEWLIIDDGSTDNTDSLIESFKRNNDFFPIRYVKTENGGKHRAINKGVKMAEGELFFIVDSDDHLSQDALNLIAVEHQTTLGLPNNNICALFGLRCYPNGHIIGKSFDGKRIVTDSIKAWKHGIRGDKGEVYVTKILKNYPYPEIEGEKFATESIVWDRMSHDGYRFVYFNENICICEYRSDGLTHQGWSLYAKNPIQWSICLGQNFSFGKYSRYEISPQIFIYYQNLKGNISIKKMSEYSGLSSFHIVSSVILQYILNILRYIGKKPRLK